MIHKKNLLKTLWIIPITILLNMDLLFSKAATSLSLQQLILNRIFDATTILEQKSLVLALNGLIFVILFILLFGSYIYQDFLSTGVYIFTRVKNRKKWFYKKASNILILSALYTALYVVTNIALSMLYCRQPLSLSILYNCFILWFSFGWIIAFLTLTINIFSIKLGSHLGFIGGYTLLIALISLNLEFEKLPFIGTIYPFYFLNPTAAITVYLLKNFWIQLIVLFYYVLLFLAFLYWFGNIVNNTDISLNPKEND